MYSVTYTGIIVSVLAVFLPKLGVELPTAELTALVSNLGVIVGALLAAYGRWRNGDITPLGVKKG